MSASTSGNNTIDYEHLATLLASAPKDKVYKLIVDAPFGNKVEMAFLFLGFLCLYVVDEKKKEIQLKAASGTEEYKLAVEKYNFNTSDYQLYFDTDKDNTIVQAITSGKMKDTIDWLTLSRKNKSAEMVRFNQANSGIAYTAVYPFSSPIRGALMYNFYQYPDKIDEKQHDFMETYTKLASKYLV